jgi:PAS domain S-box-containing protein
MERPDLEQWRAKEVARLFALVDTERRYYQEIVASLPVGLMILGPDLTIRSANRSVRRILGLRSEELLRRRLDQVLPSQALHARVEETIESGKPMTGVLVEFSGEKRSKPLRIGVLTLRNWDDDTEEALLVVEDLSGVASTESHPAVAVVPAAKEVQGEPKAAGAAAPPALVPDFFASADVAGHGEYAAPSPAGGILELLDYVDAIVWEFDPASGRFMYVSPAAGDILGFPAEDWAEADMWLKRIHPADREWMVQDLDGLVALGDRQTFEYRALTVSGAPVWLRETIRVVRDRQGAALRLYGVAVDVSESVAREELLVTSQRMDAAVRLSARLSHDFNNSLMILSGYTEEFAGALAPDSPAQNDMQEMRRATERMSKLSGELFQFARKPQLDPELVDANQWVSEMVPRLKHRVGHAVEFHSALDPAAGWISIDTTQVEQALAKMVDYIARHRTAAGGRITLETGVEHVAARFSTAASGLVPGQYTVIALADNGPAIDEDTRRRLFEPFLQKDPDPLGLATAYMVIRHSGGDVRVSSDPAAGNRLAVLLPRIEHTPEPPPEPEPPPPAEPEEIAEPEPPPETVLVVDDESSIRMLIRKILSRHGYAVLEAIDGEEAVRTMDEHPGTINLLLTDVVLPKLGGRELAVAVRDRHPDARVLYISGYNDEPMLSGGAALPPNTAYLQKPFTLGSLLLKVREMLVSAKQE